MVDTLRQAWRRFGESNTTQRFEQRYFAGRAKRRGKAYRWLGLGSGVTVLIIGIIMIPAPGPGLPMVVLGAGMIAEQSLRAARMLDRCELALRRTLGQIGRKAQRGDK